MDSDGSGHYKGCLPSGKGWFLSGSRKGCLLSGEGSHQTVEGGGFVIGNNNLLNSGMNNLHGSFCHTYYRR